MLSFLGSLSMALTAVTGPTEAACQSIFAAKAVVAHSFKITTEPMHKDAAERFEQMQVGLDSLTAVSILPDDSGDADAAMTLRIYRFLSHHHDAVRMAAKNGVEAAIPLLAQTNHGLIDHDLDTLSEFWGCQRETGAVQAEEVKKDAPAPTPAPLADPRDAAIASGRQYSNTEGHPVDVDGPDGPGGNAEGLIPDDVEDEVRIMGGLLVFLAILGIYSAHRTARAIRSVRHPCHIETSVQIGHGLVGVAIENISSSGAMISTSTPIDKDQQFQILLLGRWHRTHTIWSTGREAGIKFKPALRDQFVQELLSQQDMIDAAVASA